MSVCQNSLAAPSLMKLRFETQRFQFYQRGNENDKVLKVRIRVNKNPCLRPINPSIKQERKNVHRQNGSGYVVINQRKEISTKFQPLHDHFKVQVHG